MEGMCHSLCPAAETAVFRMPDGGAIQEAVSTHGQAYTALPNALKIPDSVDKSCACKGEGQSWAQTLAKAESMIGRRSSDIVVDAALAASMAQASASRGGAKASRRASAGQRDGGASDIVVGRRGRRSTDARPRARARPPFG